MSDDARPVPPFVADEATSLASWLDFQRATLIGKCDGLDDAALRTASVPPSTMTLLGLVRHAAEVERNWFRRVLAGEELPGIFASAPSAQGHDGGFDLDEGGLDDALVHWRREVDAARRNCAGRDLDETSPFAGAEVSLRWILTHMIGEYARHNGHADLIRERLDGRTGV